MLESKVVVDVDDVIKQIYQNNNGNWHCTESNEA